MGGAQNVKAAIRLFKKVERPIPVFQILHNDARVYADVGQHKRIVNTAVKCTYLTVAFITFQKISSHQVDLTL